MSSGIVDMTVTGSGLSLVARVPVAGTVKGIAVEVNGHGAYALSNHVAVPSAPSRTASRAISRASLFSRNDQLSGSSGNDALYGFKGSDTLSGKQGDDQLTGFSGDDSLSGSAGIDILKGGADDDDLDGGSGKDQLTGATGRNSFVFDSKLDGVNNVDTITDWTEGTNTIELDNSIFAGIGAQRRPRQGKFIVGTDDRRQAGDPLRQGRGRPLLRFRRDGAGRENPLRPRQRQPDADLSRLPRDLRPG